MIDGKPAITEPRSADREVKTAISNIRQRIEKIERYILANLPKK